MSDLPRNSHRDARAKPCWGSEEVAWPDFGGGPKTWSDSCQSLCDDLTYTLTCHCLRNRTYRKHNGDASADSFGAGQVCLLAQPQVLRLAAIALPACHGSSKQQHLNALARRQRSNDLLASSLSDNVHLSSRCRSLGCAESTGAVRAVDHCAGVCLYLLRWRCVGSLDD